MPRSGPPLDRLAARAGLSPSGLAKKAGLDPTTFNKSKRVTPDGRPRWPSTESVAKSLAATATPIESFVALIGDGTRAVSRSMPLIGLAEAGGGGYFDDGGFPVGNGWDEVAFPAAERRARLRAGNFRQLDGAGLSQGRHHHRVAGGADPPRRPRRGQDQGGRSDGQAIDAPHRQAGRTAIAQCRASGPHACLRTTWCGSRGSSGRVSNRHVRSGNRSSIASERASAPSIMSTVFLTP